MAVMDGKALTVTEIVARTGFYDYEAKYGEDGSSHILPARIPAEVARQAMDHAARATRRSAAMGSREATFSCGDVNHPILVLLEVNTQPGMTPTSLAPEQAAHMGIGFDALVLWITEDGYARGLAGGTAGGRQTSDQSVRP